MELARWAVLAVALAAAALGAWRRREMTALAPREMAWTGSRDAAAAREPVLFRDAPLRECACARWTPARVAREIPVVLGATELPGEGRARREFAYRQTGKLLRDPDDGARAVEVNTSSAAFMEHAEAREAGDLERPLQYFSVSLLPFPGLLRDIPREPCLRDLLLPDESLRQEVNLWLSAPGVVAANHYDAYHNFFFQVHGRKRFLLAPPTAARELGVLPFLHEGFRRAKRGMLDLESGVPDRAMLARLGGREVELGPGDLLYLPPFWFHHVESITTSLSINVWDPSSAFRDAEAMLAAAPDLGGLGGDSNDNDDDDDECRLAAAHALLDGVLNGALGADRDVFVRELARDFGPVAGPGAPRCPSRSGQARDPCAAAGRKHVEGVLARARALPDGVREMQVGQLVEQTLQRHLREAHFGAFLSECLVA